MSDHSAAHDAVEAADIQELLRAIQAGADLEGEDGGISLLQHAIDVEAAGYERRHEWHADMTALLLAMGADPLRRAGYDEISARQMAAETGIGSR